MHVFEFLRIASLCGALCGFLCPAIVRLPSSVDSDPEEFPALLEGLVSAPKGDAILSTPPSGGVRVGDEIYRFEGLEFEVADDRESTIWLEGILEGGQGVLRVPLINGEPEGPVTLVLGLREQEVQNVDFHEGEDEDAMGLTGQVTSMSGASLSFATALIIGAGTSTFRLEGDVAFLNGELGSGTYRQVSYLIEHCPEIGTIVFEEVPGSVNDEVNVETGRLIREAGYTTLLPARGMIASGGVDLFCAGETRIRVGGRMGVHSWGDPTSNIDAHDLPRDHPAHRMQVRYFREMLDQGEEFYFFTLEAAPFADIHWMSDQEIEFYGLLNAELEDLDLDSQALWASAPLSNRQEADLDEDDTHWGGCVLKEPGRTKPVDPYVVSDVTESDEYEPFSKKLSACGITLIAGDDVSDSFLRRVGQTIAEMFPRNPAMDQDAQSRILELLHQHRAALPVPRNERSLERLLSRHPEAAEKVFHRNSVCDIIMASVPEGQVMEVVEHILHAVTDVGLHLQFPREWGISRSSALWEAMQKAIATGAYDISSYHEELADEDEEIADRILLQEFAYWFITTAWDLQEPYGPQEAEWVVADRRELQQRFPDFFAIYQETVERVMACPSRSTLEQLGPRRSQERGR